MHVTVFSCGPAVNESERKAIVQLKTRLISAPGEDQWLLLTNLAFSTTNRRQSDEIDIVAIGPPGVQVIEVKHWTAEWVSRHPGLVGEEADRVTNKARKIGTTLRKKVANLGRVDGVFLVTETASEVEGLEGRKFRGVRFHTFKTWRATVGIDLPRMLSPIQIKVVGTCLHPRTSVAMDGALRRLASYRRLELQTPRDERFHRIYKGVHTSRRDRVILHLYDLSASDEPNAEAKARREFDSIHRLQLHSWAPRILDSFQDAPGYAGEVKFFTVSDPAAPSIKERTSDNSWDTQTRLGFARNTIHALAELHAAGVGDEPMLHRNLTPETILVKHDNSPILTGFEHARIPAELTVASAAAIGDDVTVSPEVRAHGRGAADRRSDVYSLCASLTLLFKERKDGVSSEIVKILSKGTAQDPKTRRSLSDLVSSLSKRQGGSITNPPPPPARFWTEDQVVHFGENQYRIVSRVGSGGVGTTYKVAKIDRVTQESLGTYVAKVARDEETGKQVLAAYELVHSYLRHSALSTIFEVAPAWQDNSFIALMTWIEGEPLSDYVGLFPILAEDLQEMSSETLAIRWVRTACEALDVLHRNGLVHGDVSPRNMIVSGPEVVLTDYDCVGKIGGPVVAPGTVQYCSLSYNEGCQTSASDDFYALAASFFHVLFDKPPFVYGGTHAKERGLNWGLIERDEYPTLSAFLDRATDPDPQKRFATAKDALVFLSPLPTEDNEVVDTERLSPIEKDSTEKFKTGSANMDNLLTALRKFDALRDGEAGGDVILQHSRSAIPPTYANPTASSRISPEINAALSRCGIDRLFQHQADAIQKACAGANIALQAPTASGKTLAFQVPMLQSLIRNPGTHALMLYPNKALALDQRDQLLRITNEIPGPSIDSWWYDGDTDRNHRTVLRQNPPRILITNPDMLHNSFLGHADKWVRLYKKLRWVVVDEIHEYRGYFGSNVAMILRRFSHHLAKQDVRPQFFLSSATCANAREHAENLTGLRFEAVNASNSMRPTRHFTFVQPDIPDHHYWDILQLRTVKAGFACLTNGKSVLAFCPTRKFAESCHRIAMREVEKLREHEGKIIDPQVIKVFRAGLSTDERHQIQEGLKSGVVRLVFTTNALELGIDIGGLDGIILAGFPDSMMSAWQRIGRAGRSWKSDAFVLYYARNNPLDRFYASNLETFLKKPLDDLVVNPGNEDLIDRHLPCLLFETSDITGGEEILGRPLYDATVKKLRSGAGPVRVGSWRPHRSLNIRGGGSGTFVLKEGSREIGTLSYQQQFREAYQRAIYMHGGRTYRVEEISLKGSGGEISLVPVDPYLRTNPTTYTTVAIQEIYAGRRWAAAGTEISAFYGKVLITERLSSVEEIDDRTGEVQRWTPQLNNAVFNDAHAFWISGESRTDSTSAGVVALPQLLRVGALFSIPLDAHDIFAYSATKDQKAYLVESHPGGIGIARKVLERWRDVLEFGIIVAESCGCSKGCPNCIVPPRSKEDMDKIAGVSLAQALLSKTDRGHDSEFVNGLWEPTRS